MRPYPLLRRIGFIWIVFASILGCEAQKTARENINIQYNNDRQNKFQELGPAEGKFTGSMHLVSSNQDFDFALEIKRVSIIERAPSSQSPSETIEVPKLSGAMTFPVLAHFDIQDYSNFQELLQPMGGFLRVIFDFGDYSPMSQDLILPYTVPNYTGGNFGEISGKLKNDHFTGTWFANPFGSVGTFDVVKTLEKGTPS